MIITKFTLSNFGRHADLTFDSNAPVVGLLGPNGVGKSTILDAIEYALTGEARDPLPTYVRHNEGNASVSLTFLKNGMEGYIFRQFGKSPKRKMVWDGKQITSAKEVDSTMAAVLGADKKAIANAVFINQGMLDKILFAGEADRRELFIRLVNMAFCEKHKNILEGKIKKLQLTIIDLGPALDAAAATLRDAEAAHLQTKQISEAMVDYSADHARCESFLRAEHNLRTTLALMGGVETEQMGAQAKLDTLVASWNCPSFESAQLVMGNMEDGLRTMDKGLADWRSIRSELTHYDTISREISARARTMTELNARKKALNPQGLTAAKIEEELNLVAGVIEMYGKHVALQNELQTNETTLAGYVNQRNALLPPPEDLEALTRRQTTILAQEALVATMQEMLNQKVELSTCMQPTGNLSGTIACAKCGLQVSNPEALSPESLQKAGEAITTLRAQVTEMQKVYLGYKSQWDAYDKEYRQLSASIDHWTRMVEATKFNIQMGPQAQYLASFAYIETHKATHASLTAMKEQLPEIERSLTSAQEDIGRWMESKKNMALAIANQHRRAEFTNEKEQELAQQCQANHEKARTMRIEMGEMNRLHAMLTTLGNQMRNHQTAKAGYEAVLSQPLTPVVIELSNTLQGNLTAVQAELSARMEARSQAIGRTEQAKETVDRSKAAYDELARRVASDAEKRKIIEDLVLLKDLMSAEGLPAAVVNYHFRFLAALTQTALNQLDANFSILMDDERPLSFKFVRLDEPEHEPLPMSKLSGGQRVRLCTAFLIAVQQRLVKEVGLMVLDEPSTHVDQTGVESLAEFLRTLGGQLRNTEIQIFISDHHPSLKNCFDKTLELA